MTEAVKPQTTDPEKKTPITDALRGKQKRFVLEYMIDLNGAAAARRAGHSEKTARQIASENLTKPNVMAAIDEQMRVNAGVTRAWIVERYARMANANIGEYLSFDGQTVIVKKSEDMTPDQLSCIKAVKTTRGKTVSFSFEMHDQKAALDALAKALGMEKQEVRHTGKDGKDLPVASAEGIFVRTPMATRDDWEAMMKAAQKDQRERDEAAVEKAVRDGKQKPKK